MSHADQVYGDLVHQVLQHGSRRKDRTGVGTRSLFGAQARYDLRVGFPLLTSKRVNFSAVVAELLWFLRGEHRTETLECRIWDDWAGSDGELGPIYGHQWRAWGQVHPDLPWCDAEAPREPGVDQVREAIRLVKQDPYSRRNIVSAWNVGDLSQMALPPCHLLWQLYVEPSTKEVDIQVYQRSADLALGVPFNVASYGLLLSMIAQECGLTARYLIHSLGDVHIYEPHVEAIREQISRSGRPAPVLYLNPEATEVLRFTKEDIGLLGYDPHPVIHYEVAV